MLEYGDTVLVAVSGGVDSIVLLHVLRNLVSELGLSLVVAHLDHGWRANSDEDARFTASVAEDAGIPFLTERLDEATTAALRGLGREGVAREARREFLLRAAESIGATRIATGHTADDRAETILYNLTRGAGSAGISGIDPVNEPFVRPLISVPRSDVLAFAEQGDLAWREDETNSDLSLDRNRIRHRVLPELAEINPRAVEAICRAGEHATAARAAEALLVSILWPEVTVCEEAGDVRLSRTGLASLPREVRALLLREAFRRVRGDLNGIERQHTETIVALTEPNGRHSTIDLPRLHARVDRSTLNLSAFPFPKSPSWKTPVSLGRTAFTERGFALDLRIPEGETAEVAVSDRNVEIADADRIAFPLHVRNRRIGDRFTPLGMDQPVKLKDFLINERVPFFDRDDVPLLCDREKILWIVGVRLSNEIRLTDTTRRRIVMRVETVR